MRILRVNELFDTTESEFIPFELREKIDPDFEWTDEIEDQVYYVGSRNIIKSIDKNKDYLYKMRNLLIGNTVEMYHFDHQYGEYEEPVNVLVKHVTYNMLGVICITNIIKKDVYSSYLMDERKPIKIKFKKRIFNELDPYGEEDWGYEYESKKELFVGDEVRIIQDIPGRNRIGSTGIITDFKNNRTQFKVDLTKSVRTHNWIYGEWFPKENLEKIEYSRKEIKEKKKRAQQLKYKMRDIDPYGEEDWLDESKVNENIGHDIKVGDGVICLKGNQDKFEMKDRYGVVLEILYHGAGFLNGILRRGKMYRIRFEDNKIPISFCVFSEIVEPVNTEELKKRREELLLKYKDIDPYGEENWENESKIIKKFELFNDNKINELFETEKTYDYSFIKKRKMKPFEDFIYTFTSRDKVEYFVTVSINYDNKYMSVKFTDKENYKGFKNKIKNKYSNLDNYDAINVLNTVVKICKDFYDKNKEYINAFETSTLDEKRLRVYKYILGKYFKGWDITHEIDPRGDILIEAKPKKIIENVNHPDLEPINSFIPYTIYKKFNYNFDKYYEYIKDNMEGNLVEFTGVQRGIRDTIVFGEVEKIELSRIGGIVLIQINNVIYSLNVNQPVNIYSFDSEKLKERKRKKEELRLKMMDVDWLDEKIHYNSKACESYHKSQGKLVDKYIRFTYDEKDQKGRLIIKKNVPYKVLYFNGVDYIIKDENGIRFEVDPFYQEGEDFFIVSQEELENRRKKWIESHPEDPYGEEIWENKIIDYSDIDPYGEEDWNDENEFKVGDEIICVNNQRAYGITVGNVYVVNHFDSVGDPYLENDYNNVSGYCKWRFKKVKK